MKVLVIASATAFIMSVDLPAADVATDKSIRQHIEWLSDSNEHTRRNAASALASFGPEAKPAVDALINGLSDKTDSDLRMYSAKALGAIGPDAKKAIPELESALSDESRFVRKAAAMALGQIGSTPDRVVDELIARFGDNDLYVRRAASKALAELKSRSVPALIKTLGHKNEEFRFRAANALSTMREHALKGLEEALDSDDVLVRRGAAHALAWFHGVLPTEAVPMFVDKLHDSDPEVRKWIAKALTRCFERSEPAKEALLKALERENHTAFEIVIALSERAGQMKALEEIVSLLGHESADVRAQMTRSIGLAGLSDSRAAPEIERLLDDPKVAHRAAEALFRIAPTDERIRAKVDKIHAKQKSDEPYPGYLEDLVLIKRSINLEGPDSNFSSGEACQAATRIFANIEFAGKAKKQVMDILGEPKDISVYAGSIADESPGILIYRFDTGFGGMEYRMIFDGELVTEIKKTGMD